MSDRKAHNCPAVPGRQRIVQSDASPTYDLIIVGAGPAGCAAAIRAAQLLPERTPRIMLLDKACFPRMKVCGGGVVRRGDYLLRRLGVDLHVHSTPVDAASFVFPSRTWTISRPGLFRVVRREEFDHALLKEAQSRGIDVRQGIQVLDLKHMSRGVVLSTPYEQFRARVVIGADGANGIVRKKIGFHPLRLSMVGLETVTPSTRQERTPRQRRTAVFDFTCSKDGIPGYSWDFPTGTDRTPLVNRGVFQSHVADRRSRVSLKSYLLESLHARDIEVTPDEIKGYPLRVYDPSVTASAPHLLTAGDALGVEPLLGEGISSALESGALAAEAACRALQSGDYSFSRYTEAIRTSQRMRSVRMKRAVAQRFYGGNPRWWALLGTMGITSAYLRTAQCWEDLRGVIPLEPASAQ